MDHVRRGAQTLRPTRVLVRLPPHSLPRETDLRMVRRLGCPDRERCPCQYCTVVALKNIWGAHHDGQLTDRDCERATPPHHEATTCRYVCVDDAGARAVPRPNPLPTSPLGALTSARPAQPPPSLS